MRPAAVVLALLSLAWSATATVVGQATTPTATQWDGVFTDAQADRGKVLYGQHCARCHGIDLMGVLQPVRYPGQSQMTPALVGTEFAANWNDLSLGDLFERMRISMPQHNPGSLSRQQNADILAYLLQQGNYPSGTVELPTSRERMDGTMFLVQRP